MVTNTAHALNYAAWKACHHNQDKYKTLLVGSNGRQPLPVTDFVANEVAMKSHAQKDATSPGFFFSLECCVC